MTLPKELKEAISSLSSKDKDKLIFRLLKKDYMLANQLLFQLVSNESVEEKRAQIKKQIKQSIEQATTSYYSSGYLLMDVRSMSGMITEHVKITKDKYGEVYLNLWMLIEVLDKNKNNILKQQYRDAGSFCISVIARTFKILLLLKKLHEDYLIDFEDGLIKLGHIIGSHPYLMKSAIGNGLDVNWLINMNIPDDLEQIHKDLKEKGYLRA